MTIVNPLASPAQVAPASSNPLATSAERQVDLRPEQVVRATVVEGGLDRALLELNQRHYRAQGEFVLQAGQKLTLQVLQVAPRLEFRVLVEPPGGRLNQLLPQLAHPYDWTQLIKTLQQPAAAQLAAADQQLYQQLQQLLQPAGPQPTGLGTEIVRLAGLLQQLAPPANASAALAVLPPPANRSEPPGAQPLLGKPLELLVAPLLRELQQQVAQFPVKGSVQALPQAWLDTTRTLLLALPPQLNQLQQLPAQQLQQLVTLLGQLQQHAPWPAAFSSELHGLQSRLTAVPQAPPATPPQSTPAPQPTAVPQAASVAPAVVAATPQAAAPVSQPQPPAVALLGVAMQDLPPAAATARAAVVPQESSLPAVVVKEVGAGLEQLLAQVRQLQAEKGAITPELAGRLDGLLEKLQQLPQPLTAGTALLPGLETLTSQLQLVQQGVMRPAGGPLGLLSQLFGFHLETELLNGKKRAALTSLKLSLLDLRAELGKQVEEPLQRLEILQQCKARLAEQQVQFLPLLFPELEEGYLFVEKNPEQQGEQATEGPLQLSLALRLSALGNLRIDLLYEKSGLHLRVACEDKEKMSYLQGCAAELTAAIETVPLRGVSFAADAQMPTRKLQERLLPETLGMLDTRI